MIIIEGVKALTSLIIFAALLAAVALILYKRYWPVNVKRIALSEAAGRLVIDVRDWQEANHIPIEGAEHIPCGYLPRNVDKFGGQTVLIAAGNAMERNFAVRLLKKYNVQVDGVICLKNVA